MTRDPRTLADGDQGHAVIRELTHHLCGQCEDGIEEGHQPIDIATETAYNLATAPYTRETLAALLGVALTELAIEHVRSRP